MNVTQKEVAKKLAQELGTSIKDGNEITETFIEIIAHLLEKDNTVTFQGFGKFSVVSKAPRVGVNPQTQKPIKIKGFNTIKFKAGDTIKHKLNKKGRK